MARRRCAVPACKAIEALAAAARSEGDIKTSATLTSIACSVKTIVSAAQISAAVSYTDPEWELRKAATNRCLLAKLQAKCAGLPHHRPNDVLDPEEVAIRNLSEHNLQIDMVDLAPGAGRKQQRGGRSNRIRRDASSPLDSAASCDIPMPTSLLQSSPGHCPTLERIEAKLDTLLFRGKQQRRRKSRDSGSCIINLLPDETSTSACYSGTGSSPEQFFIGEALDAAILTDEPQPPVELGAGSIDVATLLGQNFSSMAVRLEGIQDVICTKIDNL